MNCKHCKTPVILEGILHAPIHTFDRSQWCRTGTSAEAELSLEDKYKIALQALREIVYSHDNIGLQYRAEQALKKISPD